MRRTSIYFVLAAAAVLVLGGLGLRLLLKPLKRVELQAEAICRKEYHVQEKLPKTRELRQVVDSMNRMTIQVRDMFSRQAKIAERLRRKAYTDQLTGLGNRRYLTAQVEARLEAGQGAVRGALLILQVDNLQKVNETDGFTAGDSLLKKVATILRQETKMYKDIALSRLTGGDFAIFLSEISAADTYDTARKLSQEINRLTLENSSRSANLAHIGGAIYEHTTTLPKLLSEADNALLAARQKGSNQWHVTQLSSGEDSVVKGKLWWRDTLEKVLEKDDIILFGQPVVSSEDQTRIYRRNYFLVSLWIPERL